MYRPPGKKGPADAGGFVQKGGPSSRSSAVRGFLKEEGIAIDERAKKKGTDGTTFPKSLARAIVRLQWCIT